MGGGEGRGEEGRGEARHSWEDRPASATKDATDSSKNQGKSKCAEEPMLCVPCDDERIPSSPCEPVLPSAGDVAAHNLTHLPPRPWCPVCVKAKIKEEPHKRAQGADESKGGLPIVGLDYATVNEEEINDLEMIVGFIEGTGEKLAHQVSEKGLADDWAARKIVKDLEEMGCSQIILKTDGEPIITALQWKIQAMREAKTIPRKPPAYDPQANGPCEKAVQDVVGQLRCLVLALQARLGVAIDTRLPIVQWALEHAVFLLNHYSVGHDGMTAFERKTGRK